jgi:regulator of sigma E protease
VDQFGRIVAIALAFGATVFVHEAGHFIAARLAGMHVYEFSIGIGRPLLFWFRRGETQYSFRFWPFFSYVRVAGMEPGDDHPNGFHKKQRPAQAFVLVTGCIMNFLLAVAIFILIGSVFGRVTDVTNAVERVMKDTPAAAAGVRPGDRLVGLDGDRDMKLEEIVKNIRARPEEGIVLELERDVEALSLSLTPLRVMDWSPEGERNVPVGRIGVIFEREVERLSVGESVVSGFTATFAMVGMLIEHLADLIVTGKGPKLVGPVGVVSIMYEDAGVDWSAFLFTFAAVTISIGFLNLLPIPPLDGSRLAIVGIEAIRRRPFDKSKEIVVHLVGFALLLMLLVVLTYKDILSLVGQWR